MFLMTTLTKNEKRILNLLLDNARVSDAELARETGISTQGARKIRLKLEKEYIAGYRTIVDYKKIGIDIFAVALVSITEPGILSDKNIIGAFEVNEGELTHILVLGFKDIEELDRFKMKAHVQKIHVLSRSKFLKNSPMELLKDMLK